MSEERTQEEARRAIDKAIAEMLEAYDILEPPVDAAALARHLGLEPRVPATLREPTAEQRHYVAAQAIAAHLKPELLERLELERGGMMGGSLTRMFAEALLVPTTWLADEARASGYDLLALKERFATASHEHIAWRLLDLSEPCIITVFENGRVSRRRSNAWSVTRELSPPERECQQQVQRYSRPCRVCEDGVDARGWPLHTVDWKREVLRTVMGE